MSIWESLKSAVNAIFSNKLRSSLTMLGIVIGVMAVVMLVSLGQGFQNSLTTTFEKMGANALYISSASSRTVSVIRSLTMDDATALENKVLAPSISVVSPSRSTNTMLQYGNNSATVQASGIMPSVTGIRSYDIEFGRFITQQDVDSRSSVVVLGYQTAQDLFGSASSLGKTIRVNGTKFQVVGTLKKQGMGDSSALMPLTTMQSRLTGGSNIQQIAVKSTSPATVDSAISEVTSILRSRHFIRPGAADDFSITDMRSTLESMEQMMAAFSIFMGMIGAISLLVGGIGIMNIMLVSVTERTREIGIRKAIGAKRRDILLQFLIEAAMISLSGGLVGLLLATGGVILMGNIQIGNASITPETSPFIVIVALSVAIGIGLVSGTYPAFLAARLDPIESLRHE